MQQFFRVGIITAAHGIRGGVRVYPVTDDPSRFQRIKEVYYSLPGSDDIAGTYRLRRVAFQKNMVLLEFEGINDRNTAETLKDRSLWVGRKDALPLEENEYYIADLIGMRIVSDEGEDLGIVEEMMETGSNYVMVAVKDGEELLIPFIRDCLVGVDLEQDLITVHLLPGLRDGDPV